MLYKSQKGFAVLEVILLLVIVAIIGGTSWYVWQSRQETNKALDSSQDASDSAPKVTKITNFDECVAAGNPVAESYPEQCFANGKAYVNEEQKIKTGSWRTFSGLGVTFKYPETWNRDRTSNNDPNSTVDLVSSDYSRENDDLGLLKTGYRLTVSTRDQTSFESYEIDLRNAPEGQRNHGGRYETIKIDGNNALLSNINTHGHFWSVSTYKDGKGYFFSLEAENDEQQEKYLLKSILATVELN